MTEQAIEEDVRIEERTRCVEKFLRLMRSGRAISSSSGELRAHLISQRLAAFADDAGNLDEDALDGFFELVRIYRRDDSGRDFVLEMIGAQSSARKEF